MSEKKSRAEKAGEQLGNAIIEMVHLMYQNNTSANFYKGLFAALKKPEEKNVGKQVVETQAEAKRGE